ncbi:MAG: hypothetical protein KIT79_13720 [Deltaproteobacteria bacterium]|nr:hypothetical protein [Deltaproteobacteria bacterium]
MPSPRKNPPVIQALIQAHELSWTAEDWSVRLDVLDRRYRETGQENDFRLGLSHFLASARLKRPEFADEIRRRI